MNRLERFIMPLIITVGIIAIFLARAEEGTVVLLAKIVGIFLGVVLSLAFALRLLGMLWRYFVAKRILTETEQEIERLRTLVAQEQGEQPYDTPDPESRS